MTQPFGEGLTIALATNAELRLTKLLAGLRFALEERQGPNVIDAILAQAEDTLVTNPDIFEAQNQ